MLDHAGRRGMLLAMVAGAAALSSRVRARELPLELGVVPHLSARVLLGLYRPLREALQQQLQRDVQLSTAPSWARFHQRTLAQGLHCVVTAANLARLIQVDAGWLPLARFAPDIPALLVSARQRPLAQPADLRGGCLALANPASLVALRGLQWLADHGLQAGRDFRAQPVAQDDSVGALVLRGDCAAGLLSGGEFKATPEATRQQLVISRQVADVPGFVVCASPRLDAAEQAALAQAWLALPASEGGRAFFTASGFAGIEPPSAAALAALDPLLPETRRQLEALL